jgi:hypothetical protein
VKTLKTLRALGTLGTLKAEVSKLIVKKAIGDGSWVMKAQSSRLKAQS